MNGTARSGQKSNVFSHELSSSCKKNFAIAPNGLPISWGRNTPVRLSFDSEFPSEFTAAVRAAAATWNRAAGFNLIQIEPELRPPSTPRADGYNILYYMTETSRGHILKERFTAEIAHEDDVAFTTLSGQSSQIADADIVFDGITNHFSVRGVHGRTFDVESVALHELGHVIGLIHSQDPESVMYHGQTMVNFTRRDLDPETLAAIRCAY